VDLYVNFQGLKHNFEKVQVCFYKITNVGEFSEFSELFFYSKIGGIGPWPEDRVHGGWCTGP
jgi:hypothetical protein